MVYMLILCQNDQRGAAAHTSLDASVGQRFYDLMEAMHATAISHVTDDAGAGSLFLRWHLGESRRRSEKDCDSSCYSVHAFSLDGDGDRDHQATCGKSSAREVTYVSMHIEV